MRKVLRGSVGARSVKILDVTEFYSERGGGVRSHLALKGHVLCQLGHEHVVVAPGPRDGVEEPAPLAASEGRARTKTIRIRGPASPYDPTYFLLVRFDEIASIVARERPDVLEIHSPYLAALGALRARRGTYGARTFQWHSDFIDTYAGVLEPRLTPMLRPALALRRPLWSLVRAIARRCDATLVAAEWQAKKLASHRVPRIRRVPFGIERETFRPSARSFERRRELLALAGHDANDDACAVLVGVGRFAIEKRWDIVLDAFLRVRRARDCVLVLFGDGPERERMRARVAGVPGVAMPGFTKDREALASSLASADALVHGCPFETFGLSIAEAMSCGLPAVVPDEGGAAEMHADGAGEIYRALDADACATAVERLLDRLAKDDTSVREAASRAASRLPTVREQFEAQVALYTQLLAR
ncbi:MAG TPA: glycosyltransferase [Labilithrix sp.]|jgi:alpha-1,6-mannosyltransferase